MARHRLLGRRVVRGRRPHRRDSVSSNFPSPSRALSARNAHYELTCTFLPLLRSFPTPFPSRAHREETSNNRVRSGLNPRPIDYVPNAGARRGTADGIETTDAPLGLTDLEAGAEPIVASPNLLPPTPSTAGPIDRAATPTIPHLQV